MDIIADSLSVGQIEVSTQMTVNGQNISTYIDNEINDYITEELVPEQLADDIKSSLRNDGYALTTDIPSAADISAEIQLSDYALTSHNHDGTYLTEIPNNYVTTDDLTSYAKQDDVKQLEYTSIEVFPTTKTIPAGTVDSYESLKTLFNWNTADSTLLNQKFTGLKYTVAVNPESKCYLNLYCILPKEKSDITIDWGDGHITDFKTYGFSAFNEIFGQYNTYYSARICHEYSGQYVNRKNIVKIYGSYFCLRGLYQSDIGENLISRLFEYDLPISTKLKNVSSIAKFSQRLLQLDVPYGYDIRSINNFTQAFQNCKNLLRAYASEFIFQENDLFAVANMFNGCENLQQSTIRVPSYVSHASGINSFYNNCSSLSSNINDLLPMNGFSMSNIRMIGTFFNCQQLTGKIPAHLLWKDRSKTFITNGGENTAYVSESELPFLPDYLVCKTKSMPMAFQSKQDIIDMLQSMIRVQIIPEPSQENVGKLFYLHSGSDYAPDPRYTIYFTYKLEDAGGTLEYKPMFRVKDPVFYCIEDQKIYSYDWRDTEPVLVEDEFDGDMFWPYHSSLAEKYDIYQLDKETGEFSLHENLSSICQTNYVPLYDFGKFLKQRTYYADVLNYKFQYVCKEHGVVGSVFSGCTNLLQQNNVPTYFGGSGSDDELDPAETTYTAKLLKDMQIDYMQTDLISILTTILKALGANTITT